MELLWTGQKRCRGCRPRLVLTVTPLIGSPRADRSYMKDWHSLWVGQTQASDDHIRHTDIKPILN